MAQKIIKHRLFTWFEDAPNPVMTGGPAMRTERINHFGDEVDITDEASLKRGEELGSFFSDEDAKAIRNGTYRGELAGLLDHFRSGSRPAMAVQPADGEGPQIDDLTADELADYINESKLNVDQTVALAREGDADSINKVYDAEIAAAQKRDADPRVGVTNRLDAMLAAAKSND